MKRFLAAGVLVLCITFSQLAGATENRNAQIKAEIVQNYRLFEIAIQNRDAVRMISFESPDYTTLTEEKRVLSKNETDALWHKVTDSIEKVISTRAEIKKLTIESNRVVVLTHQQDEFMMRWRHDKVSHVVISAYVRDIWVNYDCIWMLKRSEDLSSKAIVDGKPWH